MPTAYLTEGLIPMSLGHYPFVPAKYNGKIWMVNMSGSGAVLIGNLTDKTAVNITDTQDPDALGWASRLIDWKQKTNSTVIMRCIHARSGTLVIDRIEADLSALTATRTEESTISLAWLNQGEEIAHGIVIPPRLAVLPEWDETANLHYIDLETGDDSYWDTGFGTYEPRASQKYVVKNDDIYMLFGRHLAGDVHRYLKMFSHQLVELESSGGGSPRCQVGGVSWFYDDLLFPATSGGVVGVDNDIFIYDDDFTKLGTIDLAGITGWSSNDAICGFNIYAKKTDGGYYMLLGVTNAKIDATALYRLYHVELNNTFGVVTSSLFFERDWKDIGQNLNGDYTDWCNVPIIDINAKKMYISGIYYDISEATNWDFVVEVDISDVWDNIAELNKSMWYLGAVVKIPTILTLQVTPL